MGAAGTRLEKKTKSLLRGLRGVDNVYTQYEPGLKKYVTETLQQRFVSDLGRTNGRGFQLPKCSAFHDSFVEPFNCTGCTFFVSVISKVYYGHVFKYVKAQIVVRFCMSISSVRNR